MTKNTNKNIQMYHVSGTWRDSQLGPKFIFTPLYFLFRRDEQIKIFTNYDIDDRHWDLKLKGMRKMSSISLGMFAIVKVTATKDSRIFDSISQEEFKRKTWKRRRCTWRTNKVIVIDNEMKNGWKQMSRAA